MQNRVYRQSGALHRGVFFLVEATGHILLRNLPYSSTESFAFSTRLVPTSRKKIINLFLFAGGLLKVQVLLKAKKTHPHRGVFFLVEATGLEPAASCSQSKHSTKLSYASSQQKGL